MKRYFLPSIVTIVALMSMSYPAMAQVFPVLQFKLTTVGSSGAATFVNNVLNIPVYSGGGGGGITALTGDGTASGPGSAAFTLATVNSNTGSFGGSTAIPVLTLNGKGLVTAASTAVVIAPAGTLSGTTLNSTVVNSSLTSVGTLGSLAVSGLSSLATLTATNATTTNLFSGTHTGNTLAIGGTATTTISSSGNVVIPSGASLTNTGISDGCATWATGVLGTTATACGSGGGGSSFPFTPTTNYGVVANSTSTPIWFTAGIQASTTNNFLAGLTVDSGTTNTSLIVNGHSTTVGSSLTISDITTSGNQYTALVNPSGASGANANTIPLTATFSTGGGTTGGLIFDSKPAAAPIVFYAGGNSLTTNERLRITGAGLIGIASSTPTSLLSVGGNVFIGAATAGGTNGTVTIANLGSGFVQASAAGLLSSAALTSGQVTTALGFTPFGGTSPLPVANGGTASTTGIANGITYYDPTNTFLTASTSFVRLASGNVGIGIANPSSKLDVVGDINFASNAAIRQGGGQFAYGSSTTNSLFVGDGAGGVNGLSSSTLVDNVGIGRNALKSIAATAGQVPTDNVGVGYQAMFNTTSGFRNVGLGTNALYSNTIGRDNMAIGYQSLFLNTTGVQNVAIGFVALQANVGGSSNIAIGYHALLNNVSGNSNLAFGVQAGEGTTGSNNVQIGDSETAASASSVTTGSNNFQIGYRVALPDPTANNQLDIGNILFGTSLDGTDHALSTGNLGVGTSSPWGRFSVNAKAGGSVPSFVVATSTTGFATSTAFEIDQNGNVLGGFNGANVGVGTTSPYSLLSVAGNIVVGAATAGGTLGDLFLPKLGVAAGSFLAVDPTGKVIATTTPSGSNSAFSPAANYATTGALPSNTYVNGTSGVGATITEVGTGALSVDGASPSVGQTVLVKNEGTASHNGLYDVTATGSGIAAFVLTRDSAYNSNSNIIPGIITYVISGTANADEFWAMVSAAPITLGTTALNYTEVSGGGANVTSVSNSDSTLTISPTTGAVVASLNLAHANSWAGLQQFANASSSLQSVTSKLYVGGTATTTIDSTGLITAQNIIDSGVSANTLLYSNGSKQLSSVTFTTTGSGAASFSAGTLNIPTGASFSGTTGQTGYFNGTNTSIGTSTVFIDVTSNLGFGASTTPYSNFAYAPTASTTDAFKPLFQIQNNENTAILNVFSIDQYGNITTKGDVPTLTNCGNPISIKGNNNAGTVQLNGGTPASACTINFSHPFPTGSTMQCQVEQFQNTIIHDISAISVTAVTVAFGTNEAGSTFYYHCTSD